MALLDTHKQSEHGIGQHVKCDKCDKTFKWMNILMIRQKESPCGKNKDFKCHQSPRTFYLGMKLSQQKEIYHNPDHGQEFMCENVQRNS